jgi:hypothetical protein
LQADTPALQANSGADAGQVEGLLTIDALDRRTRAYKRFVAIRSAIIEDLGGEDALSEVQRQLVSKFATLSLQLEATEAAALAGQAIDAEAFGRAAGHLRRLAEVIGLQRRPRDITSLTDYLTARASGDAT